ncbi:hook-length control protein FliK [Alkalibacterium subtropicum]|uniref:Hook-length control protein FliK n=1 Tax=Alkalibacterium subtropicum TaxID=753702 RepID=A0A1I1IVV9_9LACT|nr:flagellar hook-length control protein FliK [Alkalibacterium subtropicum]SFC40315.1 hook-length control protein FliK [Alkalibacterium subtropicum]
MNVTQVIQSAVQVKSKGAHTEKDGETFSKALEQLTAGSDTKEKSQLTEGAGSEELEKQSSEADDASEKEAEPATFTLVNPFLNLESEIKDIKTLGKSVIVHTETATSEAALTPGHQLTSSETKARSITVDLAEAVAEGAEGQSPKQAAASPALTDSHQLIEGKNLTEAGSEATPSMASKTKDIPVNRSELNRSDGLLNAKVSAGAAESDGQIKERAGTGPSSTAKAKSAGVESDKTVQEVTLRNSDEGKQLTMKESEPLKSSPQTSETIDLNHAALTSAGKHENQTIETSKVVESTIKEAETTGRTVSEAKMEETITQSDTDYDFVSMLRQLSSQSGKTSALTPAGSADKANIPVPKEQGMDLVQDMVTRLVENKDGQKTYQTTLHLTPETLGKVTVELLFNEEGLSGKLTFQSDEARRFMEGEWLDVKRPLESKGLNIKSFDFTTSQPSTQQQSGFSFSEQSGGSGQDSQRRTFQGQDSHVLSEQDEQTIEMNKNQPNGLNVYV